MNADLSLMATATGIVLLILGLLAIAAVCRAASRRMPTPPVLEPGWDRTPEPECNGCSYRNTPVCADCDPEYPCVNCAQPHGCAAKSC